VDILAIDGGTRLVLVEVRGRTDATYRPVRFLTGRKIARLRRLALSLSAKHRMPVRIELVEIVGRKPKWLPVFL
jgi:Holliday junction resolvase-like predicted endonuclease